MINEEIILENEFIKIDDKYFGGSHEIIENNESLKDFNINESSGFFSLTDVLLYELNKYKDTLGTFGRNNLNLEEYSKFLRNYIDSKAYRFLGFVSINSIENYIQRFSDKRRIKIKTKLLRSTISDSLFYNFIKKALEDDHPLIIQMNREMKRDSCKYSVIVGIDKEHVTLSMLGQEKKVTLSKLFEYNDLELGLLYLEVKHEEN